MDFIEKEGDLAVIPLELAFQDQQIEHNLYGHGSAVRFYFLQVGICVLTSGRPLNGDTKSEEVGEAYYWVGLQFGAEVYNGGLALRVLIKQAPRLEGGQPFDPSDEITLLDDFHFNGFEVGHLDFGKLPVQAFFGAVDFR